MNWKSLMRSDDRQMPSATTPHDTNRPASRSVPPRVPAVSIHETSGAIVVMADMPGVTQDRVDITIEQGVLTLRGDTAPESHEGFQEVYREYDAAGFERSLTLPAEVDSDHIDATVKQGVVTLTLPKHKSVQPRRIAVKSG